MIALTFVSLGLLVASGSAQKCGLNAAAKAAGKLYFGTAVDASGLNDQQYSSILRNSADFGQITPANAQKWDSTERQRNQFSFDAGDKYVNLARKNNQMLRCHTLLWHNQIPGWVKNGKFDNRTMSDIIRNHVTKVVSHFKGKCYAWDVVNEALEEDGSYRKSVFFNTVGEQYIPIAFKAAAQADPGAKLYYNDYNMESPWASKKMAGAKRIIKLIKSQGIKIDGMGMQTHLQGGKGPTASQLTGYINDFASLGVDVAITEMDVRIPTNGINAQALSGQAQSYKNVVAACKAAKRCVGVTIWDLTDKYSWVPSTFRGEGSALPWDGQYKKKTQIYNAILEGFGAKKC